MNDQRLMRTTNAFTLRGQNPQPYAGPLVKGFQNMLNYDIQKMFGTEFETVAPEEQFL